MIEALQSAALKVLGPLAPRDMQAKQKAKERVQEIRAKDKEARKPREQGWQLQMAMVMGNQWVGWNGSSVQTLEAPTWRIQAVNNKLFVRTRSKMTRLLEDGKIQCLPNGPEHLEVRRARYKERLIAHIGREINDELIWFRVAQWVSTCGECYTEAYWNEDAGDTYADDAGAISEGEAGIRIYDPFAVWPGAGAAADNNGGRLTTAIIMPVELARLKFNKVKDIAPDAGDSSDVKLRAQMDNFFQTGGVSHYTSNAKQLDDCVLVETLREYRTRDNPKGRVTTIINGKIVDETPLVWSGLTHIINFPSFNSYHGDAVELRLSIQAQKSINRNISNWEEYTRTMAKGKILAPKSANIKSNQFNSENFEVVTYEGPGQAPEPWMPPPMNSDPKELVMLRTQEIDDNYSDHMASQGKAPASASGAAINYLTEEDSRQHTPTRNLWNVGKARTYEKVLDVVAGWTTTGKSPATGYKADRMITILGEDRRADVQQVDLAMLEGKNRVSIVVGGALPQNKTLRSEVVRRMFIDGMLGDPTLKETRRKAVKMTDAGLTDDIYDDDYLDEMRAEKENAAWMVGDDGEFLPPRPEDDHAVHVWTHRHYMKTDEFLQLPEEVQGLFYHHLAITEEQLALQSIPAMPPGPEGPIPGNSPAAGNPGDMLKSAIQSGEPPPGPGL